jgi:hypothetical protein
MNTSRRGAFLARVALSEINQRILRLLTNTVKIYILTLFDDKGEVSFIKNRMRTILISCGVLKNSSVCTKHTL